MSGSANPGPDLTVVVATGSGAWAVRMVVAALAAQTVADRIELVLRVDPGTEIGLLEPWLTRFAAWRVIDDEPVGIVDEATGLAALTAETEFVSIVEDHALPDADWAETMLAVARTHDDVGFGSGIANANPGSLLSHANYMLAYSQWSDHAPGGPTDWIAHHNCTFRTEALRNVDREIYPKLFNREGSIIRHLRDTGGTFRAVPEARIRHINPASWSSTWALRRNVGRFYGANRAEAEGWGPLKRGMYVLLGAAIPRLRYLRERHDIFARVPHLSEPRRSPALMLGLTMDAIGQMIGYLAGPGGSRALLERFEMDRAAHLGPEDRKMFYPDRP
ncbi:hypothetical protein [Jannaschia aquimarina]|uniref:Glycosyl transferase family 2 n=1 Tax=Jannaschia aquimarina TaxID=935700 RepID=A0A0D1DB50_9RHOB|nr:hypothetical protein [Jannaschia aquimarina]KIT17168.1 hypothetical protein jaqu_08980 [Jannaschia aquimarina]SNT17698.1 hypothetical protein SAMN05421775_10724 [Jannaschia aquimarina]